MGSLAPTINFSRTATDQKALVSSTSYLVNIATLRRDTFDKNGWIFESDWVVNTELPVIICSHGIHIVIVGDKYGVRITTR